MYPWIPSVQDKPENPANYETKKKNKQGRELCKQFI